MAVALERLVAAALAVTVFSFACGSTIVNQILLVGRPARWICLAALVVLAVAWALFVRPRLSLSAFLLVTSALLGLAVLSASWSVDPGLTLRRAAALAALFVAGIALFHVCRARPDAVRRLLVGLLAGMTSVAVAGVVVLLFARSDAIQEATFEYAARYQGFGQNPNTVPLLLAPGIPLALLFAVQKRPRAERACAIVVAALFAGSIAASGSRGAMVSGLVGALVLLLARAASWRLRASLAVAAVAVFAVCLTLSRLPDPKQAPTPATAKAVAATRRTLLTSSGRTAAWRGAIEQAAERPLLGYGYGTEERAFVNRYAGFVSDLPENSYIGAALQLGLAGLILFLGAAGLALLGFVRSLRRLGSPERPVAAACAGMVSASLTFAVTQSYVFSVGNIATVTVWLATFLLVAVTTGAD
jgi:O-antigen ligase